MLSIRPFDPSETAAVVELWRRRGLLRSANDPHQDIRRKLKVRADLFLVGLSVPGRWVVVADGLYKGGGGWDTGCLRGS